MVRKLSVGASSANPKEVINSYNKHAMPMIVIGFDDGFDTDYTRAFPILQENGIRGTSWICKNRGFYPTEILSEAQIKEMADTGHEIGCHTVNHPQLNTLTEEQVIQEFKENKAWIESITGKTVYTHVYPYGSTSETVAHLAGAFYEGARGFASDSALFQSTTDISRYFMPYGHKEIYRIPARFTEGLTVPQLKTYIDEFLAWSRVNGGGLLMLTWHKVWADDDINKPDNRYNESQFREIVEYIAPMKKARQLDIVPFYEAVRRIQHYQYADLENMPQYQ